MWFCQILLKNKFSRTKFLWSSFHPHSASYDDEISWEKVFVAVLRPMKSAKIFNLENFRLYSNKQNAPLHTFSLKLCFLKIGCRVCLVCYYPCYSCLCTLTSSPGPSQPFSLTGKNERGSGIQSHVTNIGKMASRLPRR